jgi:hypothetical protein
MFAVGRNTFHESDGMAVDVSLLYTVQANAVAYAQGWLGITNQSGDSGQRVSLTLDTREYQFSVPAGLAVAKGQVVYIDLSQVGTNHMPPDAAYTTTSGANRRPLFRATEDKDVNNTVLGKLISGLAV